MMRIESDTIGSLPIYEGAYYGIHSYRAKENFAFTDQKVDLTMIKQVARIRSCASQSTIWHAIQRKSTNHCDCCGRNHHGQVG